MQQVERFSDYEIYHYFDICDNCANVRSRNNKMFAALRVLLCVSSRIPNLFFIALSPLLLVVYRKIKLYKTNTWRISVFAFSNDEHFCVIMAKRFWNICCKVLALNSYEEIETICCSSKYTGVNKFPIGIKKFSPGKLTKIGTSEQ